MQVGWNGLHWPGATVVILASGKSLTPEACAHVWLWRNRGEGRYVIAINTTFQLAPWADVLYACDGSWWDVHHTQARSVCTGQLWTQDRAALRHNGVRWIESARGNGLSFRPGIIHQGMNGGYQAVGLAHQAGAKKVVLLGFDMHGGHWHGEHPLPLTNTREYLFKIWIANFNGIAADLDRAGMQIVNATPGSALKCFTRSSLTEALS